MKLGIINGNTPSQNFYVSHLNGDMFFQRSQKVIFPFFSVLYDKETSFCSFGTFSDDEINCRKKKKKKGMGSDDTTVDGSGNFND